MALCSFLSSPRTVLFNTRILIGLLGLIFQINQLAIGIRHSSRRMITMVLTVFIGLKFGSLLSSHPQSPYLYTVKIYKSKEFI
jgi:hypothetical protein